MKVFSETTGKTYEAEESTFYLNLRQSSFLLSKPDAVLNDIFCRSDGRMVWVFPTWLHKKYLPEWIEKSRQYKENQERENNGC